jgi:hypothetical protein
MFESTPNKFLKHTNNVFPEYPVVFSACDSKYFLEHAPAFIASAESIGKDVHIHIYDPTSEAIAMFLNIKTFQDLKIKLTLSFSASVQNFKSHNEYRTYCACIRFVALPELLKFAKKVMTLDIDCLMMKEFNFPEKSIGYFSREPLEGTVGWEKEGTKVLASAIYFDERAIEFTQKIKERITQGPLLWFLDQVAISEVLSNSDVDAEHFDTQFLDSEFNEDSIIWNGKGPRKYDNVRYVAKKNEFASRFVFPEAWDIE